MEIWIRFPELEEKHAVEFLEIYTKTSYRLKRFTSDESEGKWITKLALLKVDRGGFRCHDAMGSIVITLPL